MEMTFTGFETAEYTPNNHDFLTNELKQKAADQVNSELVKLAQYLAIKNDIYNLARIENDKVSRVEYLEQDIKQNEDVLAAGEKELAALEAEREKTSDKYDLLVLDQKIIDKKETLKEPAYNIGMGKKELERARRELSGFRAFMSDIQQTRRPTTPLLDLVFEELGKNHG